MIEDRPWESWDIQRLIKLYTQRKRYDMIVRDMKRTKESIQYRVKKLILADKLIPRERWRSKAQLEKHLLNPGVKLDNGTFLKALENLRKQHQISTNQMREV